MAPKVVILAVLSLLAGTAAFANNDSPAQAPAEYAIGEMRVRTLAGFDYLYFSKEITHPQIPQAIGEMVGKAMAAMKEAGITPSGPTGSEVCIYRNAVEVGQPFTLDCGFMVPAGTKPSGEVKVKAVRPWRCATLVYSGGIAHLFEAITKLGEEMGRAGLKMDGEYREYYLYWEGFESPNNIMLIAFGIVDGETGGAKEMSTMSEEPRFVEKGAFIVAGVRYEGDNAKGEIPGLWETFLPRMGELSAVTADPHGAYGISRALAKVPPSTFEYLAGMAVNSKEKLPEGMVAWEIPAHTYAVFRANGVPDLMRVIGYVYGEWLPKSGYEMADSYTFEYYGETFPTDGVIEVYFPVRKK
ncbi:MAG: GyrI-like domain-containing protein [Armatimonadota bacterium]